MGCFLHENSKLFSWKRIADMGRSGALLIQEEACNSIIIMSLIYENIIHGCRR